MSAPVNKLYYGDCLGIMQDMKSSSVDLIYLDPPFNSNRSYNAIYKDETGRPLPDQIDAFCDLWTLNDEHERIIKHMPILLREAGIDDDIAEFWRMWLNALRGTQPKMLAYLSYMVQRLVVMKRLLRPAGSIYLHCDPTASHYIKVMMDGIFGHNNFRNEIVWCYKSRPQPKRYFGKKHDCILLYSKSDDYLFNFKEVMRELSETTKKKYKHDDDGRKFRLSGRGIKDSPIRSQKDVSLQWEIDAPHLTVREYLDENEGASREDWWTDINPINQNAKERMGYDTQKPIDLLDRIIRASSNEGDVVMDPFCGCATTIEAAHRLNRQWIGIDIAIHAIKRVAAVRLGERCHLRQGRDFEITGVPHTLEGAKDLWTRDKYHFQKWAVEEVDGFVTTKQTADGGIDGRLYFDMPGEKDLQSMVLEVKGGKNVTIADLRALHSVLEREESLMAGLIIMEPLGDRKMNNFQKLAAEAGDLDVPGSARLYPRIQILSVPEILEGTRFHTPTPMGRSESPQKQIQL